MRIDRCELLKEPGLGGTVFASAFVPYRGLGYREVEAEAKQAEFNLTELPIQEG